MKTKDEKQPLNENCKKGKPAVDEQKKKDKSKQSKNVTDKLNEPLKNKPETPDGESCELKQEIENLKDEIKTLKEKELRTLAEFDNFRKRSIKEKNEIYNNATVDCVCQFLDVLDNLERALNSQSDNSDLKSGLNLTLNQFKKALSSLGVEEIKTDGEKFDPDLHEAVSTVTDDKFEDNIVCEVFRKGYKLHDKVLRHAMVCVANT